MMRGNLQNSDEGNAAATRTGCAFARGRDAEEEGGWLCGKTVEGGPGLPAIALGAIGGNRLAVERSVVREAGITRTNSRGMERGIRLAATPVECEQTQREDEQHTQIHPARYDNRSHQFEQIVHFTLPPSLVVVRLDHGCEPFGRRAARAGARRPRIRANSMPRLSAHSVRGAARPGFAAPDRECEVAFR
jgi:hypothetical protein